MAQLFHVKLGELERAAARYTGVAQKSLRFAWQRATRGVIRRVIGITPPGNSPSGSGGMLNSEDKARGEAAVTRDLARIFTPVELQQGQRQRDHLLTQVQAQDVHYEFFLRKFPGKPIPKHTATPLGTGPFYLDHGQLAKLDRQLRSRVGRLAASWNAGADKLGVTPPAWVRRHGHYRGSATASTGFFRSHFTMTADPRLPVLAGLLNYRIPYAIGYAANSLNRECSAILRKTAGQSGFKTAA